MRLSLRDVPEQEGMITANFRRDRTDGMKARFKDFFSRGRKPEVSLSEERGVRTMHFGSVWIQGAMRLSDPYHLELEYTRELFAGLLLLPDPKHFTLLGLGAGSATKFAWKQFSKARVVSVELDPGVITCARQYFELPPDSRRMRTVCADGAAWLGATPEPTGYLIVDVYDAAARGPVLSSPKFYASCRAALPCDASGVMAVNLFGRHASYQTNIRNIGHAFDGRMLAMPASERGNVIVFGITGPQMEIAFAALLQRAALLKAATGLPFPRYLAGLRKMNLLEGDRLLL